MWTPSGRLTAMLVVAGVIAVRLLVTLKKWSVVPESIIIGGGGGRSFGIDNLANIV
jgi:chorismate synthase